MLIAVSCKTEKEGEMKNIWEKCSITQLLQSWLMLFIYVYQAKYYAEEVKDKSKKDIDVSNWEREFVEDLPEQQNGCVFIILMSLIFSRNLVAYIYTTLLQTLLKKNFKLMK
jgi:hypothetical protein